MLLIGDYADSLSCYVSLVNYSLSNLSLLPFQTRISMKYILHTIKLFKHTFFLNPSHFFSSEKQTQTEQDTGAVKAASQNLFAANKDSSCKIHDGKQSVLNFSCGLSFNAILLKFFC